VCVNANRSEAYGRVVKILDDLTDSKLHPDEAEILRDAADALLFCEDLSSDPAAEKALSALYDLTDRLVEGDRMTAEAAGKLTAEVEACGPFAAVS
jgi:chemotaxis regulatin CheY-phosphate phosphatase CheZ